MWCHIVMMSKCLFDKAVFTKLDFLATLSRMVDETDVLLSGRNKQMEKASERFQQ